MQSNNITVDVWQKAKFYADQGSSKAFHFIYPDAEGMKRFSNEAGKHSLIAMGNSIVAISMPTPEADFSWSDRFFRNHNKSKKAVTWNK